MNARAPNSLPELLQHHEWVVRLARGLVRDADVADDVVQRTWLTVLRQRERSIDAPRAWLAAIVRNMARQLARERRTRAEYEEKADGRRPAASAAELAEHMELQQLLGQMLLELEEPYRETLLLRFYGGLSSAEISRRSGVVHSTVRWRIQRGLELLRAQLDERSNGDRNQWVTSLLACAVRLDRKVAPPALAGGLVAVSVLIAVFAVARLVQRPPDHPTAPRHRGGSAVTETTAAVDRQELSDRRPVEPDRSVLVDGRRRLDVLVEDDLGRIVADARVQVVAADGVARTRTRTDDSGRATLLCDDSDFGNSPHPFTDDKLTVQAVADGHVASAQHHVSWPEGERRELTLQIGGPESVLRGRVLDHESNPIEGAWVEVGPAVLRQSRKSGDHVVTRSIRGVRSDEHGAFEVRNLPSRRRRVRVQAPGYALAEKSLRPAPDLVIATAPAYSEDPDHENVFRLEPLGEQDASPPGTSTLGEGAGWPRVEPASEIAPRWPGPAQCNARLRVLDPRSLPFESFDLAVAHEGGRATIAVLPNARGDIVAALPAGRVEISIVIPGTGEWWLGQWSLTPGGEFELGTFQAAAYARLLMQGPWAQDADSCRLEQVLPDDRVLLIDRGEQRMKDAYRVFPGRYRFSRRLAGELVAREVLVRSAREARFDTSSSSHQILPVELTAFAGNEVVLEFLSGDFRRALRWKGGAPIRYLRLPARRFRALVHFDGRQSERALDLTPHAQVALFHPPVPR